jgi:hypothetical protein
MNETSVNDIFHFHFPLNVFSHLISIRFARKLHARSRYELSFHTQPAIAAFMSCDENFIQVFLITGAC